MTDQPHLYPLPIGPGKLRPINSSMREVAAHFYPLIEQRFAVTQQQMKTRSRTAPIAGARQMLMWALCTWSTGSYKQIATFMGLKDHSTVIHGYRTHAQRNGLPHGRSYMRRMPDCRIRLNVFPSHRHRDEILRLRSEGLTFSQIADAIADPELKPNVCWMVVKKYGAPEVRKVVPPWVIESKRKWREMVQRFAAGESFQELAQSFGYKVRYVRDVIAKNCPREIRAKRARVPLYVPHYDRIVALHLEGVGLLEITRRLGGVISHNVVRTALENYKKAQRSKVREAAE